MHLEVNHRRRMWFIIVGMTVLVGVGLAACTAPPEITATASPAPANKINLTVRPQPVSAGSTFTADVQIAVPPTLPIVGWQFDLVFDPKLLQLNNVTTGDFLKQCLGRDVFSHPGRIDNAAGTLTDAAAVYRSPQGCSGSGVIVQLDFTALGNGTPSYTLSKVILLDPLRHPVIQSYPAYKYTLAGALRQTLDPALLATQEALDQTPTVTPTRRPWPPFPVSTKTLWPLFTPPPQPTRRPGPTETAIPLSVPAQDASGEIVYLVSDQAVGSLGRGPSLSLWALSMAKNADLPSHVPRRLSEELSGHLELDLSSSYIAVHPSPDGSRLAIEGPWGAVTILNTLSGQIEPLSPFGSTGGRFLGWHPDNRRILYHQDSGPEMGLWLVDAKGHTALVVVNSHDDIVGAAVSPDGQKVAYKFIPGFGTPGFGTDAQLRWINADGSNPQGLSTVPSVGGMWSPDGQWIAFGFTLIDVSSHQVHTLPVLPASKEDVVNFGYFEPASGLVLSPDRRMMAYVLGDNTTQQKGLAEDPFRGTTIHVVDVATGEHRPLTQDNAGIDPAWSPDGKQIVFVSKRSGTPELWAVNVDGSNLRRLTQGNQLVRYPIWRKAQKPQ